jgi:hypothetical protein
MLRQGVDLLEGIAIERMLPIRLKVSLVKRRPIPQSRSARGGSDPTRTSPSNAIDA